MLDRKYIVENIDLVEKKLLDRGFIIDRNYILDLEENRKKMQIKLQELQTRRNETSKRIGIIRKENENNTGINSAMNEMRRIGESITDNEIQLTTVLDKIRNFLSNIPNILSNDVPLGEFSTEIRKHGTMRNIDFKPKDHVEIGEYLDMIDFERATKVASSRFMILYDEIAELHRALIRFMMDTHKKEHGYREVYVPYLVNSSSMYGTGQFPKFTDDQFTVQGEPSLSLIPTAEVPVTNIYRGEILEDDSLPIKFVCHTPCFRREAGSYGKDTRGIIRQHQFEKVELVRLEKPENSYNALEELTNHAENILKKLEIPYRVVLLGSTDTGFSSAKTYDIEAWLPSQNTYREISSCSNFEGFQARRMLIRYRKKPSGDIQLIHTLNGSGLAVGRTLIAIMENYQNKDGSISVPDAIRDYMSVNVIRLHNI